MKILFIVPYPYDKAPSQRLKFEKYYPLFREAGYEVDYSCFYDEKVWKIIYKEGNLAGKLMGIARGYFRRIGDLFRLRRYDIVYIHLWVTPIRPALFEWLYVKLSKKVIYDIDDLVFLKKASHIAWWKGILKSSNKMIHLMKKSNHVITGTPYLDEFVRKYNAATTDISVTMDTDVFLPVNTYKNDHKVVIGWSGSHSTTLYFYLLKDMLVELNRLHPFHLLVMGSSTVHIEGLDMEALDWSQAIEVPTMQRFDIGVYPLPLDQEWVMGKSGGKALQYMALGIPTVATAIGANFRVIEDGVSGYLVTTMDEWKEKLLYLLEHAEERRRIGEAGRARIEKYYSVRNTLPVYLNILEQVSKS